MSSNGVQPTLEEQLARLSDRLKILEAQQEKHRVIWTQAARSLESGFSAGWSRIIFNQFNTVHNNWFDIDSIDFDLEPLASRGRYRDDAIGSKFDAGDGCADGVADFAAASGPDAPPAHGSGTASVSPLTQASDTPRTAVASAWVAGVEFPRPRKTRHSRRLRPTKARGSMSPVTGAGPKSAMRSSSSPRRKR